MKRLALLLVALAPFALTAQETSSTLSKAGIEGREIAANLLAMQPVEAETNLAILEIRSKMARTEIPLRIAVNVTPTHWTTTYMANPDNQTEESCLKITRKPSGEAEYLLSTSQGGTNHVCKLSGAETMVPFAGTDFWVADLGMEFLRWPSQTLLKKELRRGQSCNKLESIAPPGWTNGYVRVVGWYDIDTGGPVLVWAYDANGKRLKEFKPNEFKKVNGEWQVEEMEISNSRTGSRTTLRFQLDRQ